MSNQAYEIQDFSPYGYDERQYCSPGINLPVGCLMRTPTVSSRSTHTSADNLDLVRPDALADSLRKCLSIADVLDGNGRYRQSAAEVRTAVGSARPMLHDGRRDRPHVPDELAMLWVLNLSDGQHTLLDIADRAKLEFAAIRGAADLLESSGLLRPAPADSL